MHDTLTQLQQRDEMVKHMLVSIFRLMHSALAHFQTPLHMSQLRSRKGFLLMAIMPPVCLTCQQHTCAMRFGSTTKKLASQESMSEKYRISQCTRKRCLEFILKAGGAFPLCALQLNEVGIISAGFLGEFIISSHREAGELLTRSVVDQLNCWLIGGDSDVLQVMGPALKQGVR